MTDQSRRNLLKLGAWGATVFAGGFVGGAASDLWNVTKDLADGDGRNLGELLPAFLGERIPQISVGTFNPLRALEGKSKKPSHYIMNSASQLVCSIDASINNVELRMCDDFEHVTASDLKQAVVLGGPLSNPDLATLLGYDMAQEDRQRPGVYLPRLKDKGSFLRWSSFHGETTLGEFDGLEQKAIRYEFGEEVERAQYAIRDYWNGRTLRCDVDPKTGRLESEYLQIVQLWHPEGYRQTFIWGLHGHSLEGFMAHSDSFETGLKALLSRVEGAGSFQALVPVELKHAAGPAGYRTDAFPDWEKMEVATFDSPL